MDMFNINRPVLFLGAHPDDEISCAGTLHRLVTKGYDVYYAYLSPCIQSTEALGHEPMSLIAECKRSCEIIGIKPDNIIEYNFPVRRLPAYRQEILEEFILLRKRLDPGLVFVASRNDLHQDHAAVTQEAIRAFKYATILGYEFYFNQLVQNIDLLVTLSQENLDIKFRSWQAYNTQKSRGYHGEEIFRSVARMRGFQANSEYAESFEIIRMIN